MLSDEPATGPGSIADKIHATPDRGDGVLGQFQAKFVHYGFDALQCLKALFSTDSKDNEVIHIPAVSFCLDFPLDEVIKRVKVNQRVGLAQQISNRDPNWLAVFRKLHHQVNKPAVLDFSFNLGSQYLSVDPVKKLSYVQLDHIAAFWRLSQCLLGIIGSLVRPFAFSAGKRLINKAWVENRINHPINRVLDHQIAK